MQEGGGCRCAAGQAAGSHCGILCYSALRFAVLQRHGLRSTRALEPRTYRGFSATVVPSCPASQSQQPGLEPQHNPRRSDPKPRTLPDPISCLSLYSSVSLSAEGSISALPASPLRWAPPSLPPARMSFWEGAELDSIDQKMVNTYNSASQRSGIRGHPDLHRGDAEALVERMILRWKSCWYWPCGQYCPVRRLTKRSSWPAAAAARSARPKSRIRLFPRALIR